MMHKLQKERLRRRGGAATAVHGCVHLLRRSFQWRDGGSGQCL